MALAVAVCLHFTIAARFASAAAAPPPGPPTILGKDALGWLRHLEGHELPDERQLAVYCLGEFGPAARQAVPALRKVAAEDRDSKTRRLALEALGLIGPAAQPAVGDLLKLLAESSATPAWRRAACQALARIAPESAEVGKAVLKAMRDDDEGVRLAATDAAVTVAVVSSSPDALDALARAARGGREAAAAAVALSCLGRQGVAPLAEALAKGDDTKARVAAAQNLGRLGDAALPARPVLLKAAQKEKDPALRAACLAALAASAPTDPEVLELCGDALDVKESAETAERVLIHAQAGALAALRQALHSRRPAVRAAAAKVLGALGAAAAPLCGDLTEALQDPDETVRRAAVEALNELGPVAAAAKPELEQAARTAVSTAFKRAATLAAANVARAPGTPPHRSALEVLPEEEVRRLLARDPAAAVRAEAAGALRPRTAASGANVAVLAAALDDKDATVSSAAAKSLAFYGGAAAAVAPKLIAWLPAKDPRLRNAALAALAGIGPAAPKALDPLVALALSPAADDRETAALLSYALRALAPESALSLALALKNPAVPIAVRAARGLKGLKELAAPVKEALVQASFSTEEALMKEAVAALAALGPAARDVTPHLVQFLTYAAPAWRRAASEVLGEIGFDPAEGDKAGIIESLLPTLLDPDQDVAWAAYLSLYLIGPPVVPKVRELLKITEGAAQYWPLRVLAKLKADPEVVVPRLIELTQPESQAAERAIAVELLGLYAPERREAIPALLRVLGDRTDYVVRSAQRALAAFGPAAVPALEAALRGRDPHIRRNALAVLDELRAGK